METACTVWSNVFMIAGLRPGQTLLVHGGAGGIGTTAIQIAHALGSRVVVTAGSKEKQEFCLGLGADVAVNYREQDFVEEVRAATGGAGADVILDNMGAKYLDRNVDALAPQGRLVVIGLQGGVKGEVNLGHTAGQMGQRPGNHAAIPAVQREGGDRGRDPGRAVAADRGGPVPGDRRPGAADLRGRGGAPRVEAGDHVGKVLLDVRGRQ